MTIDPKQKFDISLPEIVPEYSSRNPAVRWLFNRRLELAARFFAACKPTSAVDIGCGDGGFIRMLKEKKILPKTMWGVDLNPSVTELKKSIPECSFKVADLNALSFPDQSFDCLVSLDTLEHIENLLPSLAEFRRVLTPGGHLIISEPVESFWYKCLRFILKGTFSQEAGPGAGVHYHNAYGINTIITSNGFELITRIKIPLGWPLDLFHISLFRKKA